MLGLAVVSLVVSGSLNIGERVVNHAGFIRQQRLQYRPILQSHATFPPDTFLYFIDSPLQTLDVSGLMFLRYGTNVSVSGIDRNQRADLRDHRAALVYYLDDENQFKELAVEADPRARVTPQLPVRFEDSISVAGFEVVRMNVQRNEPVIVILYWQTAQSVEIDYTVFAHLIAVNGETVAGYDSRSMRGRSPTTTWKPNQWVVDALILPVNSDTPIGDNYRVEIGLYDPLSGKQLSLFDANGQLSGNTLAIAPFRLAP